VIKKSTSTVIQKTIYAKHYVYILHNKIYTSTEALKYCVIIPD